MSIQTLGPRSDLSVTTVGFIDNSIRPSIARDNVARFSHYEAGSRSQKASIVLLLRK